MSRSEQTGTLSEVEEQRAWAYVKAPRTGVFNQSALFDATTALHYSLFAYKSLQGRGHISGIVRAIRALMAVVENLQPEQSAAV